MSNAPSTESQFENFQTANYDLKGKGKIERRISGSSGTARAL